MPLLTTLSDWLLQHSNQCYQRSRNGRGKIKFVNGNEKSQILQWVRENCHFEKIIIPQV